MKIENILGFLLIGLSGAALSNVIGMQMLANDSNIEDFKKSTKITTIMAGIFSITAAIGVWFLFS